MAKKQQATIDGITWYDVTDVVTEEVKTRRKGVITFTKYYFGMEHSPVYSYELKGIREVDE